MVGKKESNSKIGENIILIFNPKDEIYGPLSNNKIKKIYIDGYIYHTVTNYTYANILHYPSFISIIRNFVDLRIIEKTSYDLYHEEQKLTTIQALYDGYRASLKNKKIKEILLATGNNEILYLSSDNILGGQLINGEYTGDNQVGKTLMKLRGELKFENNEEYIQENTKKQVYKFYQVFLSLTALSNKNLSNLQEYRDMNPDEIISIAKKESPGLTFLESDIVWNLYNQGKFKDISLAIDQPDKFIDIYRQENFKFINSNILKKQKEIIFESYLMYILVKYVTKDTTLTDNVREKEFYALDNFKYKFTEKQYHELIERIYKLYKMGELSATLSEEIDIDMDDYPFIEKEDLPDIKPIEKEINKDVENVNESRVIYLSENAEENSTELLPLTIYNKENIKIDGYVFPNIEYYIIFSLFKMLKYTVIINDRYEWVNNKVESELLAKTMTVTFNEENIGNEESYIFQKDPNFMVPLTWNTDNIYKIMTTSGSARSFYLEYDKQRIFEYEAALEIGTRRIMDKKFSNDIILQTLLTNTGDKMLYYSRGNRYINEILGAKIEIYDKSGIKITGENIVGKHLMKLREEYNKKLYPKIIGDFLLDTFFKDKVNSKLDEICIIYTSIYLYIKEKIGPDWEIKDKLLSLILSKLYPSCFSLVNFNTDFGSPSKIFLDMISNCGYFTNNDIPILWAYFSSMYNSIFGEYSKTHILSIKKLFEESSKYMTNTKSNVSELTQDSKINVIISAMIHILLIINDINKYISTDKFILGIMDIDLAVRILLNKDVNLSRRIQDSESVKLPKNSFTENEKILIINELENLSEEMIPDGIKEYFLDIITYIDDTKIIPENIKFNRINYFSSL